MAKSYLDKTGLERVWSKIYTLFLYLKEIYSLDRVM